MNKFNTTIIYVALLLCGKVYSQEFLDTALLRREVTFISTDDKGGRYPDSRGSKVVAEYVLSSFKQAGLKPLCSGGYQQFSLVDGWEPDSENTASFCGKPLKAYADFAPVNYFHTLQASLSAEIVLVGCGNDIDWAKCKGKWVMILCLKNHNYSTIAGRAIKHGVGGIILARTDHALPKYQYANVLRIKTKTTTTLGPVVEVSLGVAEEILKYSNKDLNIKELAKIEKKNNNSVIPLGVTFEARTSFKPKELTCRNVVAMLEGSDPKLKNEYIVVGAHYDHLGIQKSSTSSDTTKVIYNGADDNASGVVGLVELAKYFGSLNVKPKRSIVFVAFDAEEEGLLGSENFLTQDIGINNSQIKAMVNLDMIGRYSALQTLSIVGCNTSKEGEKLVKELVKNSPITAKIASNASLITMTSDHLNFYWKNIPVFLLNTGRHVDYHKPTDTAEKIDTYGMSQIIMIAKELVDNLANRKNNLTFKSL